MAAGVLLGNLALVVDAGSCRVAMAANRASGGCVGGGKNRHPELSMFRLTRRDPAATTPTTARPVAFYDHADAAGVPTAFPRIVCRRRRGDLYRVAAAVGSGWDGGNDADGKDNSDWEEGLQHRLKELEEMKELEKRAAELVAERAAADGEETEGEKRERVRRELEKVAREQAEGRKTTMLMFELGQKAYGRGMYSRAIDFLEAALTIIPRPTLFGGEIQIWLAMAYDANNRHRDCIDLYQQLEKQHPCISIRRQASELRYILEAPKLKISKDEMVTIPLIGSSYDRYAGSWSDKYKNRERRRKTMKTNQIPPTNDSWFDFLVRRPPTELAKNRAFWVTVTLWLALIGTAPPSKMKKIHHASWMKKINL